MAQPPNRLFDTDAHVRPFASRTTFVCDGQRKR